MKRGNIMKKFFKEFKKFISKGNIIDLAVAVVVGGAFGKIVTSLVNDIIMPLISAMIGGVSVADWKWVIKEAVYDANGVLVKAESALMYGSFIQSIIDFLIIAFFIFLALKILMNSQKKLNSMMKRDAKLTKHERRKLIKAGKTEEEIHKIEEERVLAEQLANTPPQPKETSEDILKDIRNLLIENNNKNDNNEKSIVERNTKKQKLNK